MVMLALCISCCTVALITNFDARKHAGHKNIYYILAKSTSWPRNSITGHISCKKKKKNRVYYIYLDDNNQDNNYVNEATSFNDSTCKRPSSSMLYPRNQCLCLQLQLFAVNLSMQLADSSCNYVNCVYGVGHCNAIPHIHTQYNQWDTVQQEIFVGANFRMIDQNTLRINFRTS